jgi:hypothetical protein
LAKHTPQLWVLEQQLLDLALQVATQACQVQAFLLLPQAAVLVKAVQVVQVVVDKPLAVQAVQALVDKVTMAETVLLVILAQAVVAEQVLLAEMHQVVRVEQAVQARPVQSQVRL